MKEFIKEDIIKYVKDYPYCSFSELIFNLSKSYDIAGNMALYLRENLILWEGCTSDFNKAISELINSDQITLVPLNEKKALLVYSYSGNIINLPIAKKVMDYKKLHWLPTIIKI
jgi:hypothetical protein